MIKAKQFKRVSALVSWANHPDNAGIELLGSVREGDVFQAIYRQPETPGEAELRAERLKALEGKIQRHMDYPVETKEALKYPWAIRPFQVVPLARLRNSLRQTAAFKDLTPAEQTEWIIEHAGLLGCKTLTRSEAKLEYGTDIALIEKL